MSVKIQKQRVILLNALHFNLKNLTFQILKIIKIKIILSIIRDCGRALHFGICFLFGIFQELTNYDLGMIKRIRRGIYGRQRIGMNSECNWPMLMQLP